MHDDIQALEGSLSTQPSILATFASNAEFSQYIEQIAIREGQTIVEAILEFCEQYDIDEELIAKKISRSLKEKIAEEYTEKNLLQSNEGILPI